MPRTKYFACFNSFIQHDKAMKSLLFILSLYKTEKQRGLSNLLQVTFKHKQSDSRVHCLCAVEWILSPQNSYIEALTSSVIVFGDRAFREKLRLNEVIKVGS